MTNQFDIKFCAIIENKHKIIFVTPSKLYFDVLSC